MSHIPYADQDEDEAHQKFALALNALSKRRAHRDFVGQRVFVDVLIDIVNIEQSEMAKGIKSETVN